MEYAIIDDIEELASLISNVITIRHVIDTNLQFPEYSHLDIYLTYLDSRTYQGDIALFYREMITSAVLESAIRSYRYHDEINPYVEFAKVGLKECRILDEFTDMKFIEEFELEDKKETIDLLFRVCVDRITDELLNNKILDNYRYISLGDLIRTGIVIGMTNEELKILEER